MTPKINPVQATQSKRNAARRQYHPGSSDFASLLGHFLAEGAVIEALPTREDGFEPPKQAPTPPQKVQGFEVQAIQHLVMQVNQEIMQVFLVGHK